MASLPLLVRLYPAAWRERYGDEFVELLADRPPRLRDRLDIVVGAVDARLHPQVGRSSASDAPMPRDRSAGGLIVASGTLLTLWGTVGATQMPGWGSIDPMPSPELTTLAWFCGWAGAIGIGLALLLVATRYDAWIGGSGAVGAILTAAGLLFGSAGGGVPALVLLLGGTGLFAWRGRRRLFGTTPAVVLVAATLLVVVTFLLFAAGAGQDRTFLLGLLAYGPAWIVVGLTLRSPAGAPVRPASRLPGAPLSAGA